MTRSGRLLFRLVNMTGDRLTGIEVLYSAGGRSGVAKLEVTVAPFTTQKLVTPFSIEIPATGGAVPSRSEAGLMKACRSRPGLENLVSQGVH
jgi:hypothetical protein